MLTRMGLWSSVLSAYLHVLHYALGVLERWTHPRPDSAVAHVGSSPEPARRLAFVFAEHDPEAVSDKLAVDILQWCHRADMELVFMYDPVGHLKGSADYLGACLEALVEAGSNQVSRSTGGADKVDQWNNTSTPPVRLQVGWAPPHSDQAEPGCNLSQRQCSCTLSSLPSSHAAAKQEGTTPVLPCLEHSPIHQPAGTVPTEYTAATASPAAGTLQQSLSSEPTAATCVPQTPVAPSVSPPAPPTPCTGSSTSATSMQRDKHITGSAMSGVSQVCMSSATGSHSPGTDSAPAGAATGAGPANSAGSSQHQCMQVVLLSQEDGYSPVLQAVTGAGTCPVHRDLGPIKVPDRSHGEAAKELMARLSAAAGTPLAAVEPQLILVYSNGPLTLAGYPPWQTRSAEILHMGPGHQASEHGFRAALQRFCSVKQRWGR